LKTVAVNISKKLPKQLQSDCFGFVKLSGKTKKPFEKEWQNKPYTYEGIQSWIEKGHNYGVLGGHGDLVVIDADTNEIDKVVKDELPPTFTVRTPLKGHHYYYICKDIKNKIVLTKDKKRYGEIITKGSQAVGAGSIHPDTGTEYEVVNDIEITEISQKDINTYLAEYIPSENVDGEFDKLIEEYGEPYYCKKDVVSSINESFWAGLHNDKNMQLYEPSEKCFYRYDDSTGLYIDVSADVIKQEISKRMLEISREKSISELEGKRTNIILNNIIGQLKGISEKRDAFDRNTRRIVHLANGVIEFKADDKPDFVSFSPEFYSRNQSPIPFDEYAQYPRFLNELLKPATSHDDAILIQKYTGLCLLGNNLVQRILILDGEAGRGKSTISIIIQRLVGLSNVTQLRTSHLDSRFELFRYLKKTLLTGVDVPGDFLSKKGAYVLKALVGGDILDAEQKGGTGNFPLQGNFSVVITSNSRLQVRLDGDIGAWRRRLFIVRFEGPVPKKKIPDFAGVLITEEGSGILNWALCGLQMVLEDIRIHGDIQLTDAQSGVVDALLAESDSLRHFLSDCVVSDENSNLTVSEIEEAYAEYCPSKKWNPKPITIIRKELEGLMLELFQTTKSNSISRGSKDAKGFRKVRLKH
jgi:P4 family phage/plasmid primase-like protien